MLIQLIQKALKMSAYEGELLSIMDYATLPAGKLFRPRLVEALAQPISANHQHLAAAIELHHAYTLVHDDLPAMDNGLIRRGKPSTHVKFGQWQAILGGDALLVASFSELSKINHPNFAKIMKLFTWATGAKGLILGQYLDLDSKDPQNFQNILRIHELKTARLIQVATLGTLFLNQSSPSLKDIKNYLGLGREIGVAFQLLDDFSDYLSFEKDSHEEEVNPFFADKMNATNELRKSIQKSRLLINRYGLSSLDQLLTSFLENSKVEIFNNPKLTNELRDSMASCF